MVIIFLLKTETIIKEIPQVKVKATQVINVAGGFIRIIG